MELGHFSFGIGDRFGQEGAAQLRAFLEARREGVEITPVWNKSNREHTIIGSTPNDVRTEADTATQSLGWNLPYFVDADHIGLTTVDRFIKPSDFFTIDVANAIGGSIKDSDVSAWSEKVRTLTSIDPVPFGRKYLPAVQEAGRIYRRIVELKGADTFIPEISMDETDSPQTPDELLLILHMIAQEQIPVRTIAPKFSGRFNKGVDYVGNPNEFETEFDADIKVIAKAVSLFGLPSDLKLSIHSGSDKFAIYPKIRKVLSETGAGIHVKTAGTTWLEEIIGLAESGGSGLALAREIYYETYGHREELSAPYATVLDINPSQLPKPDDVNKWDSDIFVGTLRHEQTSKLYNRHFRQLLHVGFKIAAKMGSRYIDALNEHRASVERNVFENIYSRHLKPLFLK